MADYPPGYDPSQADPNSGSYISPTDQAIGGAITLGAFAAVSVGVFFTVAAVEAGVVATGEGFVVNGEIYYGISAQTAAIYATMDAEIAATGAISIETANLLMEASMMAKAAGTTAALIALTAAGSYAGAIGSFFPSGM